MSKHAAVDNPKGLPIVEAKKSLTVEVTARDVRSGRRLDTHECAFAKACKRMGVVQATILVSRTYLTYPDRIVRYLTPEAAARELIAFDRGGDFGAGVYTFRPAHPNARLVDNGGRRHSGPKKGKKNRTPRPHHFTTMVRTAG